MALRLFVDQPLAQGSVLTLPEGAARHAQVRRLQPGDALVLFDGRRGEWLGRVEAMGRRDMQVRVDSFVDIDRESACAVTLAVGMPANERMDTLVEKATELGMAALQPLVCARAVLRLEGERAERRREHWQAIAVSASEQSGRTRVPVIEPVRTFSQWLQQAAGGVLLSPAAPAWRAPRPGQALTVLSGPEGGLADDEQAAALERGFVAASLGPRVLRADTAPLAALTLALAGA